MPDNASRSAAALYDQFEDEHPVADWGGDELFTRMPRPRAVDNAPAPRFHPSLIAQEPPSSARRPSLALVDPPADRRHESAKPHHGARRFDESGAMIEPPPAGRPTKVITGHPGGAPRPLLLVPADRRRPARTTAEWVGPRPERIVGWAFALGLILILIAIFTS